MEACTPEEICQETRIQLVRLIAKGGMSCVYEGVLLGPHGFRKSVAVKTLLPKWSENDRFMRLFIEEARLVSDLVHENITQILQLGRLPGGAYYIVMEYVEGLPLGDLLAFLPSLGKRLPEALAVHIASRVARGLAYAHEFRDRQGRGLGIVHRDVCPRNILLTTEGLPKLTDFGVAKALDHTVIGDHWLTGKIPYMSPEQAGRRPLDFRSDIFSLGAVLFEMLAGTPIRGLGSQPLSEDFAAMPIPWPRLAPDTGPALRDILGRMLAPDPANRFPSMAETAKALEYYIYKDGYGPTIQTVEAFLREQLPYLYCRTTDASEAGLHDPTVLLDGSA